MLSVNDRDADYVGLAEPRPDLFEPGQDLHLLGMRARLAAEAPPAPPSVAVRRQARLRLDRQHHDDGGGLDHGHRRVHHPGRRRPGSPSGLHRHGRPLAPARPYTYLVDDIAHHDRGRTAARRPAVVCRATSRPASRRGRAAGATHRADGCRGPHAARTASRHRPHGRTGAARRSTSRRSSRPASTYTVSAWVRLAAARPASTVDVNLGANQPRRGQRVSVGGRRAPTVGADGWVQDRAAPTRAPGRTPAVSLYIEAVRRRRGPAPRRRAHHRAGRRPARDPSPAPSSSTPTSRTGLDGWGPRDGGRGAPDDARCRDVAHGGTQSALVTDRLEPGRRHRTRRARRCSRPGPRTRSTAWVRFAEGQPGDEIWLSLRAATRASRRSPSSPASPTDGWTEVDGDLQHGRGRDDRAALLRDRRMTAGPPETRATSSSTTSSSRVPEPAVIEDITADQGHHDFPVGVAIDSRETTGSASELLLRHFDQITPENHMKPEAWYDADAQLRARTPRPTRS